MAVVVGVGSVPAHANESPVAGLLKGAVTKVTPPEAAPILDPVTGLGSVRLDSAPGANRVKERGSVNARRAQGGSQSVVAGLGNETLKTASGDMALGGAAAECTQAANGPVHGATGVVKQGPAGSLRTAAGSLVSKVPAAPPAAFRVASTDPGTVVALNKQVRDPLGGMTSFGVNVDRAPGAGGLRPGSSGGDCLQAKDIATQVTEVAKVTKVAKDLDVDGITHGVPLDTVTGDRPLGSISNDLPIGSVTSGLPIAQRQRAHDGKIDTVTRLLGAVTNTTSALPQRAPVIAGLGNLLRQPVETSTKTGKTSGSQTGASQTGGLLTGGSKSGAPGQAPGRAAGSQDRVAGATDEPPAPAPVPAPNQGPLAGLFGGLPGLDRILPTSELPDGPAQPTKFSKNEPQGPVNTGDGPVEPETD
ncbi:hypothetical protein [Actinomadura sp. 6N118]|uniref:hypothetical protein n=1 Tax=Actinomadura sp. 6N118 TaxID=3375151 RepID=UPI0037A55D53